MATSDDVVKVAKLARLQLTEAEMQTVQTKFQSLLEHFKFLAEVQTDGVEPIYHAVPQMKLRSDEVEPALSTESLLQNAPSQLDHCFNLPRVVGGAE